MCYMTMPFSPTVLEDAINRNKYSNILYDIYKLFGDDSGYWDHGHLKCLQYLYLDPLFYVISSCFSISNETSEDFEKRSVRFLEIAAELGDGVALLALAVFSETGDSDYPLDDDKAEEYYKKSSETGLAWSCFVYGYFYLRRKKETEKEGLALIEYAAKQGLQDAIDFVNKTGVHALK
ncbi:hypothetical protein QSV37_18540 [Acinetobacter sp. VNK23]|uniref:tetratricopeptide repeat protein n=1 Tax=Acinetobacter thutiue TaxID=2998078 RepID=UPI0025768541|nr:hypothetical protein [Acinetobacter thutiue]MDM1022262.1 hypothetical protein [Acinetobacter thutiue]